MTYIINKVTKDIFDSVYCDLVLHLLKNHGAVEITEDEYGCIIDVREVQND